MAETGFRALREGEYWSRSRVLDRALAEGLPARSPSRDGSPESRRHLDAAALKRHQYHERAL
jgi:hypothetical protein